MTTEKLRKHHIEQVMELLCECFFDDHYYLHMFPDPNTRKANMRTAFYPSIMYCIQNGYCRGVWDGEMLVAFLIAFDYRAVRSNDIAVFRMIFAGDQDSSILPFDREIHQGILNLPSEVLYCLSIAVKPEYQQKNIGSGLMDAAMEDFPTFSVVGDVSNQDSLAMYRKRNFTVDEIDCDYHLVIHQPQWPRHTFEIGDTVLLAVPNLTALEENAIGYRVVKNEIAVFGAAKVYDHGVACFRENPVEVSMGVLVQLRYEEYLKYQRFINVSQYDEVIVGNYVYYIQKIGYSAYPLMNETLEAMLPARTAEWSLIADVFVSVPVQYCRKDLILSNSVQPTGKSKTLLKTMDFRTHYEAGVPSSLETVDDLASFKKRMERFYLGNLPVQISSEISVDNYEGDCERIGAPTLIDLVISIDKGSNCAVLTWYSLSAPFLLSHLMDNIIRNNLSVVTDDQGLVNFYDYVAERFGLIKRGTPKIYTVIPKQKECLRPEQLASLLAGETIYPDGENFGQIVDPEILSIVNMKQGMGQYDRACVYAYSNVVLQFYPDFRGTLRERLCEESITQFYIELILLEEAAIHIADREIVKLISSKLTAEPVAFLGQVDKIYDDYSKTIDFWDIQVNYPTSQKSISMLRKAFKVGEQLEYLQRNQNQLQMVFDTKCDIIDRNDAKRMDTSLAIISVLAVFSAWIDGYDYLFTWNDVLPMSAIHILQRILFLLILVTAGYAIAHLFGNKIGVYLKMRKDRSRRRNKRRKNK